jgi:hypothetical protein
VRASLSAAGPTEFPKKTIGARLRPLAAAAALLLSRGARAEAPVAAPAVEAPPVPPATPAPAAPEGVKASLYGFVELDLMHDSTQSFAEAIGSNTMARPGTLAGDNPRTQLSARDSRVGLALLSPMYGRVRTSSLIEIDFFGNQAPNTTEDLSIVAAAVRLRHAWVKFETPVLDVLAGQTHDLFGWGGYGFYPNTVAFLGVPGQIYHRDPQLRLSKRISSDGMDLEIAAAAVRPAQRDGEIPDFQGGARITYDGWQGGAAQGASKAGRQPLAIGISGVYRRFSVPAFTASVANPNQTLGWGAAANLFLPIIPASSSDDIGNTLSATAEATMGTGIANLYTGLTGGVLFPVLPNPAMTLPVPVYLPGIDQGLVTYDAAAQLRTVNWRALVVGLQYRAPFDRGRRLGLSAVGSRLESNNAVALTPIQGRAAVFSKTEYVDGNVFLSLTPESQLGASVQFLRQTFGDGVYNTNIRGQLAVYYFF